MLPTVTLVTPTYRRRETLLRAARSVADQDYPSIEHVIVGDRCPELPGLEDQLRSINPDVRMLHLPDWRHPMARYVSARIARARNAGVLTASGVFVGHLDSDNTIETDHVSSLVDLLQRSPRLIGAHCYRRLFCPGGEPYTAPYHPWATDAESASRRYDQYVQLGIYRRGTNVCADALEIRGRFFGLDANEFFFRRIPHQRYLFPMFFTEEQVRACAGEDELLSKQLHADRAPFGSTGRYTLNFFVGGKFTEHALTWAKRAEAQGDAGQVRVRAGGPQVET